MPEEKNNKIKKVETERTVRDYSQVIKQFGPTRNPLSAFMVQPQKAKMQIQDKDEKILLLLRRHWITNLPWIGVFGLMLLAPWIMDLLPMPINLLPDRFGLATVVLWYLLTLGIAIEGFLSWYYNVYVITDERIIDVDFVNLIYKNISVAKISNIEDVSMTEGGALRSILNFGDVRIQTAGEKTEFEFEDVPKPQQVVKFLNEMILEEEREELEGRVN